MILRPRRSWDSRRPQCVRCGSGYSARIGTGADAWSSSLQRFKRGEGIGGTYMPPRQAGHLLGHPRRYDEAFC
jgi:hypothetical protein